MRRKILISLMLIVLVAVLTVTYSFSHLIDKVLLSEKVNDNQRYAASVALSIEQVGIPTYNWQPLAGTSVIFLDDQQKLVKQWGVRAPSVYPFQGVDVSTHWTVGDPPETYVLSAVSVSEPRGWIVSIQSFSPSASLVRTVRWVLLLALLGSLLLSLGVAVFLFDRYFRRVKRLQQMAVAGLKEPDANGSTDELGDLEYAIGQMRDQCNRAQEAQADFLTHLAHEIRTPLSYVQGYNQILAEGLAISQEQAKQYHRVIAEETVRIQALLKSLIETYRLYDSQLTLNMEELDLIPIIQEVVDTIQPNAWQKGMRIILQVEPVSKTFSDIVIVVGDPVRLRQALFNLVHNAVQYSHEGGHVLIEVKVGRDQLFVAVEDDGPGIPAEDLALIWERFYRVEKSRNRKVGGFGLGLSIVKQIIEAHQGLVQVYSEEGSGTRFTFVLPVYRRRKSGGSG